MPSTSRFSRRNRTLTGRTVAGCGGAATWSCRPSPWCWRSSPWPSWSGCRSPTPGARERDARAATAAARVDLEQLLSYDHQTIAAQAAQNAALLTGPFRQEYATTMARTIAPVAQKTEAVVRARTYEAGVMRRSGDTVTVQLFVNQAKTAQGQAQPSVDQNRVIATLQRVNGRWLVAGLSAY